MRIRFLNLFFKGKWNRRSAKRIAMMKFFILVCVFTNVAISCNNSHSLAVGASKVYRYYTTDEFVMGVDLSYLNQIEDHGGVYLDSSGVRDPVQIMKGHGANLVRVRLWNNPEWVRLVYGNQLTPLYSGFADVVKTIQRAKSIGLAVNLDIHYSDRWADPGTQNPPAAWLNITNLQTLRDSVYNYTFSVLSHLNAKGLMPEIVQIGNETNCGMMITNTSTGFPNLNGCSNHWQELGAVINSGIRAVRDVSSQSAVKTKIALHVADPKNLDWWFGNITTSGAVSDFDIIGLSYYPIWHTTVAFNDLPALIKRLKNTYNRKVMILETAYPWIIAGNDSYANQFGSQTPLSGYPFTREGQEKFLTDLTQNVIAAGGSGIMYWEPDWISSQMKDSWGTGSSMENCTFFDFSGNTLPSIDFMRHSYSVAQ